MNTPFSLRLTRWLSLCWLLMAGCAGLFAPWVATDIPWYVQGAQGSYYPAFAGDSIFKSEDSTTFMLGVHKENVDWTKQGYDQIVWAPVPFGTDKASSEKDRPPGSRAGTPGQFRHVLGTNEDGRDVLAALIWGARRSIATGLAVALLAGILGIGLGAWAGYWGDQRLKITRGEMLGLIAGIFPAWFYGWEVSSLQLTDAALASALGPFMLLCVRNMSISMGVMWVFFRLGRLTGRLHKAFQKPVAVPADAAVLRSIELLNALPLLLLYIALSSVFHEGKNDWLLILLFALTSWTFIARLIRAEFLKLGEADFVQAARALGLPPGRVLFSHMIPHALSPALSALPLIAAATILAETGLSYLGITNADSGWGNLLSEIKSYSKNWWILLFPGLTIFFTILSINTLSGMLRDLLNPALHTSERGK
ncbi:MAG: ABC transporter permease [Bacteroidetes bacterium]|nr:MAG: ABC transporter permease [Bacteroidota bacterium]